MTNMYIMIAKKEKGPLKKRHLEETKYQLIYENPFMEKNRRMKEKRDQDRQKLELIMKIYYQKNIRKTE